MKQIGIVFTGGFLGGLARYLVADHWPPGPTEFPWAIFVVNTVGAFVLGVIVVIALDVLAGSRYLRPLLGSGFCGALTTFSSVAVAVDQLLKHHHWSIGFGYLFGSVAAGLAAAALGVALGRRLPPTAARRRLQGAGR